MMHNTCCMAPVLSDIACYIALLYSITRVLYSQGVIWRIWVLYSLSSDPRFQMLSEPESPLARRNWQAPPSLKFRTEALQWIRTRSLGSLRLPVRRRGCLSASESGQAGPG